MNAEIVTSGTELLLGETVDTNSTYIARQLRDIGVNLYYKTSVGDNVERMALVLRHALERSDLVITTGGLGPTVDDVTRDAVALATGRPLALRPECLEQIEAIFARWRRPVGENNRKQAYLPGGFASHLESGRYRAGFHRRSRRQSNHRPARRPARDGTPHAERGAAVSARPPGRRTGRDQGEGVAHCRPGRELDRRANRRARCARRTQPWGLPHILASSTCASRHEPATSRRPMR